LLAQQQPQRHVRVFNLGLDTATTAVSVSIMALVGVHLKPDLVIVYQGANDLSVIGTQNLSPDHSTAFQQLDLTTVWGSLQERLPGWMLQSYAVAAALGVPGEGRFAEIDKLVRAPRRPAADRFAGVEVTLRHLNTIQAITAGAGGRTLFSTFAFADRSDPSSMRFNHILRSFFDEQGFPYVDQAALLPADDPTVQLGDLRYTARGAKLLARNFASYIEAHDLEG